MKLNNVKQVEPEDIGIMNVFKAPSDTSDTVYYFGKAYLELGVDYFCSCPGFKFRETCKHVDPLKSTRDD